VATTEVRSTAVDAAPAPATDVAPVTEPAPDHTVAPRRTVQRVLWIGDSIAADEAPAVLAALSAAGLDAVDGAFAARRLIRSDDVDPQTLYPRMLADAEPDVVVVQPSLWDDDFPAATQRAAYEWFWELVRGAGAELVFVTAPPLRADQAHPTLAQHLAVIEEFVVMHPGTHLLVAGGAWGTEFDADIGDDGAPDRKPDGVHVCPQGAARFASWLVDELDRIYDGASPVFPSAWVGGPWTTDATYDTPVGSCAAVDPGAG
jgi:hypothetical protein